MSDQTFPECDQFTGRKRAICRGEAGLPLDGPNSINAYRAAWGLPPILRDGRPQRVLTLAARAASAPVPRHTAMVGDAIHAILTECGIRPNTSCGCTSWIGQMNAWGVAGCQANRPAILKKLDEAAKDASWLQWAKVAMHGYLTLDSLLDAAIRRASPVRE